MRVHPSSGSALPTVLEGALLVPSAVEDVQDIYSPARLAVVDEILARRKAPHASSYILRRSSGVRVLAEYPESVRNAVDQPVRDP